MTPHYNYLSKALLACLVALGLSKKKRAELGLNFD